MSILRRFDPRPLIDCPACQWPDGDTWRPTGHYADGITLCGLCRGSTQVRWSHRLLLGRWRRVGWVTPA